MIDTAILILGFVSICVVGSLCALEYSYAGRQLPLLRPLRQRLPGKRHLHLMLLSVVCLSTVLATAIANQHHTNMAASQVRAPVPAALLAD